MFKITVKFDDRILGKNLATLSEKVDGQIHAVMSYQATKAESHMRTTAPWTDRTGNARSGLSTDVGWVPGKSHSINLFHRVPYGIFLETRWAGKFAVILPTIQQFGPDTMRLLSRLFSKLGGGMP
jgi:hypothetical protein